MKILITGSNGMLAKEVIKAFGGHDLILADIEDLDITKKDDVLKYIQNVKPEYIINCAAYTAVDKAEEMKEICYKVNALGPKNLAMAAKENDIPLIHISTDYVFDGDKDLSELYLETDETNPKSVYGLTKRDGENEIINNCDKYYIFRTSWLFGDGPNFVKTMIALAADRDELNVVDDQFGSPTYAKHLARIIKDAIEKQIPFGIYHTNNLGFTNWYEFAKLIFELSDIKCKVNPVSTEEFPRPAKRPKNSKLSKDKLLATGITIPTYQEALKEYLESIK